MMRTLKDIQIELSVDEIAEAFWSLDHSEQAEFFEKVVAISEKAGAENDCDPEMQWCYMGRDATPEQRRAMQTVTAFAWWELAKQLWDF